MIPKTTLTTFILVVVGFLSNSKEVHGQLDQVQNFFQQSIFNPIRDTVREGVQEISGIVSQITKELDSEIQKNNSTSGNSSDRNVNKTLSTQQPLSTTLNTSDSSASSYATTDSLTGTTVQYESTTNKYARSEDTPLSQDDITELKLKCPELAEKHEDQIPLYRYSESEKTCMKLGYKGKCGIGMQFFISKQGSIFGECECKAEDRLYIYNKTTNACYKIFTQGSCPEGQWIDLTPEGQPICKPNPCFTPGKDMVKIKGKCAEVNKHSHVCAETDEVLFTKNKRNAECRRPGGTIAVPAVPCTPGNSKAIHGKCHVTEWDFGDENGEENKGSNSF